MSVVTTEIGAVAEFFATHLEVVGATEGSKKERAALKKREVLLANMTEDTRRLAAVLATGIARLCSR